MGTASGWIQWASYSADRGRDLDFAALHPGYGLCAVHQCPFPNHETMNAISPVGRIYTRLLRGPPRQLRPRSATGAAPGVR